MCGSSTFRSPAVNVPVSWHQEATEGWISSVSWMARAPRCGNDCVMDVRWGRLEDAEGIAAVHVEGWQIGYRGQFPDQLLDSLTPQQRVPRWTRSLQTSTWPTSGTLVAESQSRVILGFAHLMATRDADGDPERVCEVAGFYVAPVAWRQGVGRVLMETAVSHMRAAAYLEATLWVLEGNERAIDFYRAMGFQPDHRSKDDVVGDGFPVTDLRFRKLL